MKTPLAEGKIGFRTRCHIPTPPEPEVVSCQIDNPKLFPTFLNYGEALVFGYFTLSVCYCCRNDSGARSYHVVTKEISLAEVVPFVWEGKPLVTNSAPVVELEISTPEAWHCRAEPLGEVTNPAGQGLHAVLTGLLKPRRRNLAVNISSTILVHLFRQEEYSPGPHLSAEGDAPSQTPAYGKEPPPAKPDYDKNQQWLLETLTSREQKLTTALHDQIKKAARELLAAEKEAEPETAPEGAGTKETISELVPPPKQIPKETSKPSGRHAARYSIIPVPSSHGFTVSDILCKGKKHVTPTNKKSRSLPRAGPQNAPAGSADGKTRMQGRGKGAEERQPGSRINKAASWPNLTRLQPPSKPPGG